jgi:hypothetical protein
VKAFIFALTSQLLAVQPQSIPPPAAPEQTLTRTILKAQYAWGYSGMEGEGKGTLNILLEPASEKVVVELYGLGERLMFLSGDREAGYRVQIPRRELDLKGASFGELPLPFLPQLGTAEALHKLLTEGSGPGVKVTKRDGKGPVKLRYSGQDERGKDVMVWLQRTRWDLETATPD